MDEQVREIIEAWKEAIEESEEARQQFTEGIRDIIQSLLDTGLHFRDIGQLAPKGNGEFYTFQYVQMIHSGRQPATEEFALALMRGLAERKVVDE